LRPPTSDSKRLQVALYQYRYGKHMLVGKKEIEL